MEIRKTRMEDLHSVLEIFSFARDYMKQNGNPDQWKNGYPDKTTIVSDIKNGNCFVLENHKEICGVFSFIVGKDPTYETIDGKWLNDKPYGTVHRIASNRKIKGVFMYCLDFCRSIIENIRIDTHRDNRIMQHLLEKNGFTKCGVIRSCDGSPRIAYQKDFR